MLETRKVFIDTQSFVKAGLHFDGPAFKSFRKYCEANELFHVSTSVVDREIKSKIALSVNDAISAIQTFRRKARLLSSLDYDKVKGLFEEIPDEDIHKKAGDVFDDFMSACSTEIVEADGVDPEELLSLYFDRKPPFGDGKKKAEFPDAISILSLKSYLQDDEKIYVVSDDGDLKVFCADDPNFISVESLDKLLDIYTTHTSVRHEQVKQYFIVNEEKIKHKITEFLEECDVYNSSTWEDAEVDDGLTVISLGDIEPSVLYIDDEESQVTFDIDVEFEVTVTGPDFNNGIYDREDGRMYTFDSTSRTSTISTIYTVEVFLHYEFIDGELVNAEDDGLYISGTSGGIEVAVEENEPDWY
ncbi:PIN domain-containing protein [Salinivibrio sp. ML290]|uniref:PIN domain-containing protein n=1 Tax=Salinivibrio sp. ML290 TaxID=1909468 RepID=UPI0009884A9B|nr:PIN domain-containing protein [Salinivibrio sp. ML290]